MAIAQEGALDHLLDVDVDLADGDQPPALALHLGVALDRRLAQIRDVQLAARSSDAAAWSSHRVMRSSSDGSLADRDAEVLRAARSTPREIEYSTSSLILSFALQPADRRRLHLDEARRQRQVVGDDEARAMRGQVDRLRPLAEIDLRPCSG